MNQNFLLLSENNSDVIFPFVKEYINGKLPRVSLQKSDVIVYKSKTNILNNEITIIKNFDCLYGLEIYGVCEDVFEVIDNVDLIIGGWSMNKYYLNECYVSQNDNNFFIKIDFSFLFLNYPFLPIISIQFQDVKIRINGNIQDLQIECYLIESILNLELREQCVSRRHDILMNQFNKYDIPINGNRIIFKYSESELSCCNFINYLRIQFEFPEHITFITIYGNNEPLTILTQNDIEKISPYEYFIKNFYYKTFLFNHIILEFDKILNNNISITTSNYNVLSISNGNAAMNFIGLRREVYSSIGSYECFYLPLPDNLYIEKVIPKDDKICSITHEPFDEKEEKIYCGKCFTCFKKFDIEEWFKFKKEKICPLCRIIIFIWYVK